MKLSELASTIRSKNAGVDHITFDVIFRDTGNFRRTVDSGALSPATVAELYRVAPERVTSFVVYEPGQAIKFTIRRRSPAGSAGEPDPFGSQCYPPLFDVEVP
ncbi:DUF4387 domain-containing protein [Streptomyces sp. WMMB 322]|uniref:DUF4387 domain-containing protein n=1 Tax=Streptomyces sp. WMMB 322 TaxID=1286821 RepID=UPI0006E26380|nr:DUF4387 domain-containing protein [Streptomyces sp. WMMB 322]SCK31223.1 protein of unknown function [Streptomyces sp. WMMB 322]